MVATSVETTGYKAVRLTDPDSSGLKRAQISADSFLTVITLSTLPAKAVL